MPERRPRLEGKVAIVTGAGSSGAGIGNGKATAILFAREGAKVLLVDFAKDRAEQKAQRRRKWLSALKWIDRKFVPLGAALVGKKRIIALTRS